MSIRTRAAVIRAINQDWEVLELELDDPKEREVLIRFEASGMCHSDAHLQTGAVGVGAFPLVGGHEGAGVIEKVGPGVTRVAVGDRVVCSWIPVCGRCRYCSTGRQVLCDSGVNTSTGEMLDGTFRFHLDGVGLGGMASLGSFAERAVISENACVKMPGGVSFELAALVGCGVPTGFGAAVNVARVRPGDTVVIYGAGGVGSNAVQGAALSGARNVVVVEPVAFKRDMAKVFGATHCFASHDEAWSFVQQDTWGQLADHAIITVGTLDTTVVNQAASIIGKGGSIVPVAAGKAGENQIEMNLTTFKHYNQRMEGVLFGNCNPLVDIPRFLRMYESGQLKLEELITRRYALDEINEGYRDLHEGRNIRGVVVHRH
jgi:S-(hydroxymethyl)glutathione dehydrogenase/alcohol dehydrogenase